MLSSSLTCRPCEPTSAAAALALKSPLSVVAEDQADRFPDSKSSEKIRSEADVAVALGGTGVLDAVWVAVGGTGVSVGVAVGGTGVSVGSVVAVEVWVAVGGTGVADGSTVAVKV